MPEPTYQDFLKYHTRCPKCGSSSFDELDHDHDGNLARLHFECAKCDFQWMEVFESFRLTDSIGHVLAEKEDHVDPDDLATIMEFAKAAIDSTLYRKVADELDLPDDECQRILKVIEKYLNPTCVLCGKPARVDEFCAACADAACELTDQAMKDFRSALDSGPHDSYEEGVILENLALTLLRGMKKQIEGNRRKRP